MLRLNDETMECEVVYGKDSRENTVSILWLIPQYAIITVGEVLNSATAGEFVYTQDRVKNDHQGNFEATIRVFLKFHGHFFKFRKKHISHRNVPVLVSCQLRDEQTATNIYGFERIHSYQTKR